MIDQLMGFDPLNGFLILSAIIVIGYFTLLFGVSILTKNNNVVDIGWGLGFPLLAWLTYFVDEDISSKQLVISILMSIWGLRLALYLILRNYGSGEDWRYRNLRKSWYTKYHLHAFLKIYLFQAVSLIIVSLPLIYLASEGGERFSMLNAMGGVVWVIGFLLESTADLQLYQFRTDASNKGKLLTDGVWSISRHPNYLGEILMWFGIALIAISGLASAWLLIAPVFLTIVILKVSGVSLLERKLNGYDGYYEYIQNTGTLLPRFRTKLRNNS